MSYTTIYFKAKDFSYHYSVSSWFFVLVVRLEDKRESCSVTVKDFDILARSETETLNQKNKNTSA